MSKLLIGADPECFVVNSNGVIKSAIGKLGGSKENPRIVPLGGVQEDNTLAEFNIEPASSLYRFEQAIVDVMASMEGILIEHELYLKREVSAHSYSLKEIRKFGPKAMEFGCDPDYNAWTGKENPRPQCDDEGLRTAGGHIHIGYPRPSKSVSMDIIRACDYHLGLPSVFLDTTEGSAVRKQLYGKAGAHRIKRYGAEYRSLSNFWIFTPELRAWAFESARDAYHAVGQLEQYYDVLPPDELQRIINDGSKDEAEYWSNQLQLRVA